MYRPFFHGVNCDIKSNLNYHKQHTLNVRKTKTVNMLLMLCVTNQYKTYLIKAILPYQLQYGRISS